MLSSANNICKLLSHHAACRCELQIDKLFALHCMSICPGDDFKWATQILIRWIIMWRIYPKLAYECAPPFVSTYFMILSVLHANGRHCRNGRRRTNKTHSRKIIIFFGHPSGYHAFHFGTCDCEQLTAAVSAIRHSFGVSLTVTAIENKMDVRKHFQHFSHSQRTKLHGADLRERWVGVWFFICSFRCRQADNGVVFPLSVAS